MRALALAVFIPFVAQAEGPTVSVNATIAARWLDELRVSGDHQAATLSGGGLAFGGSVDVSFRLSRLRLGGQLAAEALEHPSGDLDVARSAPLVTSARSRDSVSTALFLTAAPFAGLGFGEGVLHGWLDLLVSFEVLSAKVEGARMFGVSPAPTLRLGFAMDAGAVGVEVSVLGTFVGTPRVALAVGLRL